MGFWDTVKKVGSHIPSVQVGKYVYNKAKGLVDESDSTKEQRANLNAQGNAASGFANVGEQGYGAMSKEAQASRDYLRRVATGQEPSVAGEQLRQGLQQNMSAQRSMAASAAPGNQAMAARSAANNMNRAGIGMSGQAALAGMQERQAAQQALADMILKQRQQDAQVALGSRQNAVGAYGGAKPEGTLLEKVSPYFNAAAGVAGVIAASDERKKESIEHGSGTAREILAGLQPYSYKYKDASDGRGKQFGVMAQDLERAGLRSAVVDTPDGKYVDGAKAATASLGLVAALSKRVTDLEESRKDLRKQVAKGGRS